MKTMVATPDENTAAAVTSALIQEQVTHVEWLPTGNQNRVYAVKTTHADYVIRLALPKNRGQFVAGLYWQELLLPLGVPLARFIAHDLEEKHSPFPALIMPRLTGKDIGAVYTSLTKPQKKTLAQEMARIHTLVSTLPDGKKYGYAASYEALPPHASWHDFLMKNLTVAAQRIEQAEVFGKSVLTTTFSFIEEMKSDLLSVPPKIFLNDTTVKNVIVDQGRLTGIVDVDDMCFGDPLFVLALTYAGSEIDGHDTDYAEYWEECLTLNKDAKRRLELYRLLHTIWFMGENSLTTANGQILSFDTQKLDDMYQRSVEKLTT